LTIATNFYLGHAYTNADCRQAAQVFRRNVTLTEGHSSGDRFGTAAAASVLCRADLAHSLAELGDISEGMVIAREAARIAESIGQPFVLVYAGLAVGHLHEARGQLTSAIDALEGARSLCEATGLRHLQWWVLASLGHAHTVGNRSLEAIPLIEEAIRLAGSLKRIPSRLMSSLSEAYLLAGKLEHALDMGTQALEVSRQYKQRVDEAYALRVFGEIAARQGAGEARHAEESYRQALTRAEQLGMRPLVAHCHLGLGRLYRRTDQREQAQSHLATAATMYRQMDVLFWGEQAKAELDKLT
jgi:tetratricopeptide (TPR) repeat protein